ncbi:hypothetical protein TWF730_005872 [Orbilia blumenaviensis]|uniref:Uncharacterized protein n=1 Tax=Orbilia blumenaviensis TaxID=1796055 RepID=A0AAV9VMG1_9PEZI
MANIKAVLLLAGIAATNAYIITFDLLGYEPIFAPDRKTVVNRQLIDHIVALKSQAQAEDPTVDLSNIVPDIDWDEIQVNRIPEKIEINIAGRVGRERCLNIIPPLFTTATPAVTRKDLFKPNNLIAGHGQEYFPPYSLFNPEQQWQKPSMSEKFPYLREGIASDLPKAEITKITVFSRLDPDALPTVGPAGPPPLAIALYAKRDCKSRGNTHAPEAVIRFWEAEGEQSVVMDKLNPDTGILEAQSWEELDINSDWWATAIGEAVTQPRAVTGNVRTTSNGSNQTSYSSDSGEKLTPTRVHVGDAYVSGRRGGPPEYIKNVVEPGENFGLYLPYEAVESLETMKRKWPIIENHGYGGPNRLEPKVKMTGTEYLTEGLIPEADSDSEIEEVDPGRTKPTVPARESLYNPLSDPLPRERVAGPYVTLGEEKSDNSDVLPPLIPLTSSEEEKTVEEEKLPPLADMSQLWAPSNANSFIDPDFEALDLFRMRSGGMNSAISGGSNPDPEEVAGLDILAEEDYVNELDELE